MTQRVTFTGIVMILCMIFSDCTRRSTFPILKGPYLGQKPPGNTPELFAPGIVSTGFHEHSFPSFSPDGTEILWTQTFCSNYTYEFPVAILSTKQVNGLWSEPEYVHYSLKPVSGEAFFPPDGEKIYFSSTAPVGLKNSKETNFNIWFIEKTGDGWSGPKIIGNGINTDHHETQPTVTLNGTLYYNGYYEGGKNNYGIYRSRFINGEYAHPEFLPGQINTEHLEWTPFIAPDESYLLFSAVRPGGYGSGDIYVSFRNDDETWTDAINLGPMINESYNERYPYVSPDGKYLFYVTDKVNERLLSGEDLSYPEIVEMHQSPGNGWSDVYWMDAKIIYDLKSGNLE